MRNRLLTVGLIACCAWPALSVARVWVGGDVGLTGGALAGTAPIGIRAGLSTRSFPVGLEIGYQILSVNPGNIDLFTASALYRQPIARVPGLHFLARLGIANVNSTAGAFVRNSTRPLIGVGVSYPILPHLNMRAEYDIVWNTRTAYGPSENGNELLGGVTYSFGG